MKPRHHLYLDEDLTERLEALAARPGASKSAIVADALRSYLAREGAREIEAMLRTRLDRLTRHLGRLERDQQILLESLALFLRQWFTVTPPLAEGEEDAARALGQARFEAFIDQVGRQVAGGGTLSGTVGGQVSKGEERP